MPSSPRAASIFLGSIKRRDLGPGYGQQKFVPCKLSYSILSQNPEHMFCLYGICSQASRYVESFLEVVKKLFLESWGARGLDRRCYVTAGDLLCSRGSLQEKRGDEVRDGNSWNCAHWLGRQGSWLREERRRKKGGGGGKKIRRG